MGGGGGDLAHPCLRRIFWIPSNTSCKYFGIYYSCSLKGSSSSLEGSSSLKARLAIETFLQCISMLAISLLW